MDLERDLRCPICLEFFSHPMILPCSHVLCRKPCAENLFSFSFIRCPVCRECSYVNGGLETLPRVFALENIIEKLKTGLGRKSKAEPTSDVTNATQENTSETKKAKKTSASHCSSSLCISDLFPGSIAASESLETSGSSDEGADDNDDDRSMFCSTCQLLCCRQHRERFYGHSVVPVEEAYAKFKISVVRNLASLREGQSRVRSVLAEIDDGANYIQNVIRRKRDEVNLQCDLLIAEIEKKRTCFLADLDYEERMRKQSCDDVTNVLTSVLTAADTLCDYSQNVLTSDPETFLEFAPLLDTQLITTTLECESCEATSLQDAKVETKIVDLRLQRQTLRAINYLTPPDAPRIDVTKCSRSDSVVALVVLPSCACQVDEYVVHYHTDKQPCFGLEDTVTVITDNELANSCLSNHVGDHVILLDNLQSACTYYFSLYARNSAGRSTSSEVVQCCTLRHTESIVPVPVILETLCHTSETSASIYSSSPSDVSVEQSIEHRLLYRPTANQALWNSETFLGDEVHTVYGLDSDKEYEFMVMAANSKGECQLSSKIVLRTLI